MRLMRDLVGTTFSNRYRLVARVAGGGMGEVYRGHDVLLDRPVAVKVLQPVLAGDPEFVDRFRQEARAAARLLHPNVVAIYDYGSEDEQTHYIVMEYVPGTDLRDVLVGRGALEGAHAAEIMAAVCDALAAAHSVELVHRDVKPENVLIARSGKVKVADFGIAVVTDAERTAPGGGIPGTLRYLSPEQAAGRPATAASDIWAAGAMLSECLTGRPPLQGSGADLLRRRAEEGPVAPSSIDSRVPHDLDQIVLKACALDPEDRYATAGDMAADIRRAAQRSLPDAPPVTQLLQEVTHEVRLPEIEATGRTGTRHRARHSKHTLKKVGRVLLAIVLIAAIGFGAVQGARALLAPTIVDVPSLVRLDKDAAVARLNDVGLNYEIARRKDKFEARNEVLDQSHLGARLEEGSVVSLIVSSGPPKVRVPELIGLEVPEASTALRDDKYGMSIGDTTKEFSLEEEGTIISYSPHRDRLAWGSVVDVVVSKGPQPIEIPNVVGMGEEKGFAKLEEAGFQPVRVASYSDDVPVGEIISTDPKTGAIASESSEVQVYVSIGPEFEEVRLPDVRGMSVDAARAELESLGLRVRVMRSCDGGSVVETDPVSGTVVRENDIIALFVC
jgi:eukaryotic-like serine/threonine-protein kinase